MKRTRGNVVAVVRNRSREKTEKCIENRIEKEKKCVVKCEVAALDIDHLLKWMTCRKRISSPLTMTTCREHVVVGGGGVQDMPGTIIVIGNRFRTIFRKKSGRKWMPPCKDGVNQYNGAVAANVMTSGVDRNDQKDKNVPHLTGNIRI